jgi:uncharacterized protein YndB with AHSA1/START domain
VPVRFLLGLGLAGVLAAPVVVTFNLPTHRELELVREIPVARAQVFPLIADLRKASRWVPGLQSDPTLVLTYSDPAMGAGATCTWIGVTAGEGTYHVLESQPDEKLGLEIRDEQGRTIRAAFDLKEAGAAQTQVHLRFEVQAEGYLDRWRLLRLESSLGAPWDQALGGLDELARAARNTPTPIGGPTSPEVEPGTPSADAEPGTPVPDGPQPPPAAGGQAAPPPEGSAAIAAQPSGVQGTIHEEGPQ